MVVGETVAQAVTLPIGDALEVMGLLINDALQRGRTAAAAQVLDELVDFAGGKQGTLEGSLRLDTSSSSKAWLSATGLLTHLLPLASC